MLNLIMPMLHLVVSSNAESNDAIAASSNARSRASI